MERARPLEPDRKGYAMSIIYGRRGQLAAGLAAALLLSPHDGLAKGTGLLFVSNEKSNELTLVDPRELKVVGSIKTSRRPRDMHFNQDQTLIYVACGDSDVIDVVDIEARKVVDKIPTGASPETFKTTRQYQVVWARSPGGVA